MKLLRVIASHFKNCEDNITIDLVAQSKKTTEDKEYELQEVAPGLYSYNTAAFVGKNASGKTTAIELLDCCYTILGEFRLEGKHYSYADVQLAMTFFHEGNLFKYTTTLQPDPNFGNRAIFTDQHIYRKKYFKTNVNDIFRDEGFEELNVQSELPEDTSRIFFILKKRSTAAVYFDCNGDGTDTYALLFKALKQWNISADTLSSIIKIFDVNVKELSMVDDHNFRVKYLAQESILSDKDLIYRLSSGTTKGIFLYTMVVASLENGFDLLIDEVENHFHKTLVENIISLYKDKKVNRHGATLIFTTHYCELLDLFNRQDNIWVCHMESKISLSNMYEEYNVRPVLLKSRQFYNNVFQTAVNYEELMGLKRKLMG